MPADPFTPAELEAAAAAVHQAYLDTCARLGWPVKPANQVPYDQLSEESKELDRASVRAVAPLIAARVRAETADGIAAAIEAECIDPEWPNDDISRNGNAAAAIARAHRTTPGDDHA